MFVLIAAVFAQKTENPITSFRVGVMQQIVVVVALHHMRLQHTDAAVALQSRGFCVVGPELRLAARLARHFPLASS